MGNPVHDIKKTIASDLQAFEQVFKESMRSNVSLLNKIMHYIVKRKGKQMRPMFVFLSAKMLGKINDSSYKAASLIELLHTATLVHDDVVDDAMERRGFFSINALWKNKIAVLVGDYLLSRALILSIENSEFEQLRVIARSVKEMSEGELLQIEKSRKLNFDEDIYFEIIRQKTASLIASCCEIGATSVNASPEDIEKMRKFGELVGMAFQIKDDLFDYDINNQTGKPTGIDIKERKVTLPLLYAVTQGTSSDKKKIVSLINKNGKKGGRVIEILDFVHEKGGIAYAERKMNSFAHAAINILDDFENNEAKTALISLVEYTINRKK